MRLRLCVLLLCVLPVSLVGQQPTAAQWPRFRGANGAGVSETDRPPTTFGPSSNRLWHVEVPPGHSSPAIWGDHLFVTALENSTLIVMAFRRRDGTLLWRQDAPSGPLEKVHPFSNPAASTPATDGQRVYTYFGSYGLLAHDFTGKEVWRKPLPAPPTQFGSATSPIVFAGKVILQLDGNDGRSELLAFDARSGDAVWRTPRPLLGESWSTPIVWTHDGRDEIITLGSNRLTVLGVGWRGALVGRRLDGGADHVRRVWRGNALRERHNGRLPVRADRHSALGHARRPVRREQGRAAYRQ